MGDMVFFIPPVLATLKRRYPGCHITFVTAWGFKDKQGRWGKRDQDGFCIHLMMTNPLVDELVHWHDTACSIGRDICVEEGRRFQTWNQAYFNSQKTSGNYDGVYELDFGISPTANPIAVMYQAVGLASEDFSHYQLQFTDEDLRIAREVMHMAPRPRIVFLEGLAGSTTRGWDSEKTDSLAHRIKKIYGIAPLRFGADAIPEYAGRPLTLRQNIATLLHCDVGIGVLSGPLHMAAAVGLPTVTLYCDQPLHRAAPAFFLNRYISDGRKKHRTVLGPSPQHLALLKSPLPPDVLTAAEVEKQKYKDWVEPGRQATKSCLAVITVDEVMRVVSEIVPI